MPQWAGMAYEAISEKQLEIVKWSLDQALHCSMASASSLAHADLMMQMRGIYHALERLCSPLWQLPPRRQKTLSIECQHFPNKKCSPEIAPSNILGNLSATFSWSWVIFAFFPVFGVVGHRGFTIVLSHARKGPAQQDILSVSLPAFWSSINSCVLDWLYQNDWKWLRVIEDDWKWFKKLESDWYWSTLIEIDREPNWKCMRIWVKAIRTAKNELLRFHMEGGAKQQLRYSDAVISGLRHLCPVQPQILRKLHLAEKIV